MEEITSSKSKKIKFFRDPIHDIIRIDNDFILKLIDTPAMQRLRKIRQLGLAWLVYPGAEHSRFCHSLGTYHLAKRVINHLNNTIRTDLIDKEQKTLIQIAALLHDVGHGPFSHVFENFCKNDLAISHNHEKWTKKIIREDKEIFSVLTEIDKNLPEKLIEVFDKTVFPNYLGDIISSQLDVDRFDYLLRDSYMTGAKYGSFDLEWIIRTLSIDKVKNIVEVEEENGIIPMEVETVVIDGSRGLSTLEQYIIGRHYMFKHVYFHKTIRAAEALLRMILKRAAFLIKNNEEDLGDSIFKKLINNEELTVKDYLTLNDFKIISWIEDWAVKSKDEYLKDLSSRFIHRRLFKCYLVKESSKGYANLRDRVKGFLKEKYEFYFVEDEPRDIAYKDYFYQQQKEENPQEIWYLDESGRTRQLTSYDGLVMKAKDALSYDTVFWHGPENLIKYLKEVENGQA